MNNRENTQHIAQLKDNTIDVTQIIGQVYEALTEKDIIRSASLLVIL